MHVGQVDQVDSGNETVEVSADSADDLDRVLSEFTGALKIKKEHNKRIVILNEDIKAVELSKYFIEKQFTTTHFMVQKINLEKQFMEILRSGS